MRWRWYYRILVLFSPLALFVLRCIVNPLLRNKRVRVVLLHPDGRVLLVINALGDRHWTLPGGGVGRHEDLVDAAIRELHEELKINLPAHALMQLGEVRVRGYQAPLFVAQLSRSQVAQILPDKFEIYATQWYDVHHIPSGAQSVVRSALELLSRHEGIGKMGGVTLS